MPKIINDFNIKKQAEELGVSIWQAPSFLFLVLGLAIIIIMFIVYNLSKSYDSPEILIISETIVAIVIFTIGNFVIKNMEVIAKANRMKSEFVSIASHQLKTPVARVNWSVELLLSKYAKGMSDKQVKMVKDIAASNGNMGRMVNDLLDVARLDQGTLPLAKDDVDILEIVDEVHENNKVLAKELSTKIKIVKPENLPKIIGDKRRIKVAIDNLVSNAIKYTENDGFVEIKVEKEGEYVNICVKDNGVGIPENQQSKIFQKFFRSDNVAKLRTDGTGLGLFITKNIIEQSGGKIWFKSIEHVGSSFCIAVPLRPKSLNIIK